MTSSRSRNTNPFWGLVIVAGTAFCVTILAYLASGFGSPAAPMNRFFTRYGFLLVCIETGVIVAAGIAALAVDRRQTLRRQQPTSSAGGPARNADRSESGERTS